MSATSAAEDRETDTVSSRDTFMILFCRSRQALSAETLQRLRDDGAPAPRVNKAKTKFVYRWHDMKLELRVLPRPDMQRHLEGTELFVWWMYQGQCPPKRARNIIKRLHETRQVIYFDLEPLIEGDLRMGRFYTRLCFDLDPLFFFETSFYDSRNRAYLNIDRTYDRKANID